MALSVETAFKVDEEKKPHTHTHSHSNKTTHILCAKIKKNIISKFPDNRH